MCFVDAYAHVACRAVILPDAAWTVACTYKLELRILVRVVVVQTRFAKAASAWYGEVGAASDEVGTLPIVSMRPGAVAEVWQS